MDRAKSEDAIAAKGPAVHRRGISRKPARRPRSLCLWRARQGRHHASGVPQRRALDCAALRRAARRQDQGRADLPDRHRLGGLHPQILPRRALARGSGCAARRHRAVGAHVLRLDGPLAGLQGVADEHARRQLRFLRQVRRQRQGLVPPRAGERAVHEPRHRQSAGRPRQAGGSGQGRLHHHPERHRRRDLYLRRQGGGDRVGADALQFSRPERRRAAARHRSRGDVHRADECAGRETVLPHFVRDDGERDGHAVRLSAVVALRRERRDLRVRQRLHSLGRRAAASRSGKAEDLLPAVGISGRLSVPGLHAACGEARLPRRRHRQGAARCRLRRVSRQSGHARRGHRLAQSVLGA